MNNLIQLRGMFGEIALFNYNPKHHTLEEAETVIETALADVVKNEEEEPDTLFALVEALEGYDIQRVYVEELYTELL